MHLIEKLDKEQMKGAMFIQSTNMFGVQVPLKADRCEIWGTSFNDVGGDYCEYRFFDGVYAVGTQRVAGY
jgi:hypothetical protein